MRIIGPPHRYTLSWFILGFSCTSEYIPLHWTKQIEIYSSSDKMISECCWIEPNLECHQTEFCFVSIQSQKCNYNRNSVELSKVQKCISQRVFAMYPVTCDGKNYLGCPRGLPSRGHNMGPIDFPLLNHRYHNASRGFSWALISAPIMPGDASLSESCTPDRCSFSTLAGNLI